MSECPHGYFRDVESCLLCEAEEEKDALAERVLLLEVLLGEARRVASEAVALLTQRHLQDGFYRKHQWLVREPWTKKGKDNG
jgi:hypothetical protein